MKNKAILVMTLLLGLVSCTDNDDTIAVPTPIVTKTQWKVDGNLIVADSSKAVLYTSSVAGGRMMDVFVYKGGEEILEMHMPPKTGSFAAGQNLNTTSSWLTYKTNGGLNYPNDYFNSTSGNMAITTCDTISNKILADFHFVGNNSSTNKNITEGKMYVQKIVRQ